MPKSPARTQSPLNLILPIAKDGLMPLMQVFQALNADPTNPLKRALTALGNVHFAQFVFMENGTRLGVLTIYDDDFDDYILSFVEHIGDIFNQILEHIEGGPAVVPVQSHRREFLAFIDAHNLEGLGVFSAYPNERAYDIQDALAAAGGRSAEAGHES